MLFVNVVDAHRCNDVDVDDGDADVDTPRLSSFIEEHKSGWKTVEEICLKRRRKKTSFNDFFSANKKEGYASKKGERAHQ